PAGIRWGISRMASRGWNLVETMGGGGGFVDFDQDGLLDIYLVSYTLEPQADGTVPRDALYRNNGDGTFTDVTSRAGLGGPMRGMGLAVGDYDNDGGRFTEGGGAAGVALEGGKGLGVVAADLDGDGRIDLFQANDTAPNFLFKNRGDGTFAETGLTSDVAFDASGRARGAMGVD